MKNQNFLIENDHIAAEDRLRAEQHKFEENEFILEKQATPKSLEELLQEMPFNIFLKKVKPYGLAKWCIYRQHTYRMEIVDEQEPGETMQEFLTRFINSQN